MADEQKPAENAAEPPAAAAPPPPNALEQAGDQRPPESPAGADAAAGKDGKPAKPPSGLKKFLKRFNVYLLLFVLLVVVGAVVAAVSYFNSQKAPSTPALANQELTANTLKQLANTDATIGGSGQTLTVQGNAIFDGQLLGRSDLDVAGNLQVGGTLTTPSIVASNSANLANTQINSLQVASTSTLQGAVTISSSLNVGGAASFSGPITATQITVGKLIMGGNAQLSVPNHLGFSGPTPSHTIDTTPLGQGGTASLSGSDTSGTININTGSNTQPGCFMTIKFAQAFTSQPHVEVTPIGAGAGQTQFYVDRSTTSFSVCTDNAAPTGQTFAYDYLITD